MTRPARPTRRVARFAVLAVVATALCSLAPGTVGAQEPGQGAASPRIAVRAMPPRDVGWFVGDRFTWRGEIDVPEDYVLDPASLPAPGPLDRFTEIGSIAVDETAIDGGRRYRLRIVFQSFYVPLEPREIVIPALDLRAVPARDAAGEAGSATTGDEDGVRIELPGWRLVMAPLRPILERSSIDNMKPDREPVIIHTIPRQQAVAGLWIGVVVLMGLLMFHRGWGLTGMRRSRPLAAASRAIRRLRRKAGAHYEDALVRLHRGLDAAFGGRVMESDLDSCLARAPRFAGVEAELRRFFEASRRCFFDGQPAAAQSRLPFGALEDLSRRLAAIERAGGR